MREYEGLWCHFDGLWVTLAKNGNGTVTVTVTGQNQNFYCNKYTFEHRPSCAPKRPAPVSVPQRPEA
jgi:hypothetical protein